MNGFHHLLEKPESFNLLVDMLRHLRTEEMFFHWQPSEEPQMLDAHRNLGYEESVLLIQKHTGLKHCQLIGEFQEGGKVYRLSNRAQSFGIEF